MTKKTLAIFSFTSCEGCQFEALNHFEEFGKLLNFFRLINFRLGQQENIPGPFDVSLVEGSVENEEQIKLLKDIRRESKVIVAIGACAHLGGIQSERNSLPKSLINKNKVSSIDQFIKVDYTVPGCPINHRELYKCLMDIYWGKEFILPDLSVCQECRQNENDCLLREQKVCLGPITRGGCNSVCRNGGEACLGCRGPIPQPNLLKMKEVLGTIIDEKEIVELMTIYGDCNETLG